MRFMMLVTANKDTEAGVMPSRELVAAMGTFNQEMADAGVLRAGEGLHPSAKVFEASDFGAEFTPKLRVAEDRLRAQLAAKGKE